MKSTAIVVCLLVAGARIVNGQQSIASTEHEPAATRSIDQTAADACDYDRCALRFTLGFGSWSILQGIDNRKVGRLGMFRGPNVEKLVQSVPEAAEEARRFRRGYAQSSTLIWGGAALAVAGSGLAAANDGHPIAIGLSASGFAAMIYGTWRHGRSFDQLSHSLWLYNRSLRR